ncbi:Plasmodium yoelii subtelomeric region (PYST-C1), putative [Plasmodium chabaudi adami]|uniref:Plasmodium yoelii subtelomeric region (PYST-C1), putative n=1 Tax=Plasmodium chabaudi adami TaxID=5826 RepID=A0A1D3RSM7_PLACE|nr:Plasmodium yoelii subtelomeric region (PYST-C1), putative [Plasmodium chabaudi adami]
MNKRIFSLVCIVWYGLLTVSIHCSEHKVSGLRNKFFRAIKKISRSKEKNGIEFKCEPHLNNNNNNGSKYDETKKDKKNVYYQMSGRYGYWSCCC